MIMKINNLAFCEATRSRILRIFCNFVEHEILPAFLEDETENIVLYFNFIYFTMLAAGRTYKSKISQRMFFWGEIFRLRNQTI